MRPRLAPRLAKTDEPRGFFERRELDARSSRWLDYMGEQLRKVVSKYFGPSRYPDTLERTIDFFRHANHNGNSVLNSTIAVPFRNTFDCPLHEIIGPQCEAGSCLLFAGC
jgi:hypothetical protein